MNALNPLAADAALATTGLALHYGDVQILKGIDLSLAAGTTLALLGPSGCGKTTLLRLLAGLLAPTKGSLSINGAVMADASTGRFVPPEKRGLGMVFQDYALWPHMNVFGNVAFPLEMAGVGRAEITRRVGQALDLVGLADYGKRGPGELSGGQQQRVAIARAIVGEPRIVLFDEPLSNLDRELRETLAMELAALVRSLSLTAVYVTHDQSEAFTVADQVAVMQHGLIAQLASPLELVDAPQTVEVAEFLKLGTIIEAERDGQGWRLAGTAFSLPGDKAPTASRARVLLPRKAVRLAAAGEGRWNARVVSCHFRGDFYSLALSIEGLDREPVQAVSPTPCALGTSVGLTIEPENLRWFPAVS